MNMKSTRDQGRGTSRHRSIRLSRMMAELHLFMSQLGSASDASTVQAVSSLPRDDDSIDGHLEVIEDYSPDR